MQELLLEDKLLLWITQLFSYHLISKFQAFSIQIWVCSMSKARLYIATSNRGIISSINIT